MRRNGNRAVPGRSGSTRPSVRSRCRRGRRATRTRTPVQRDTPHSLSHVNHVVPLHICCDQDSRGVGRSRPTRSTEAPDSSGIRGAVDSDGTGAERRGAPEIREHSCSRTRGVQRVRTPTRRRSGTDRRSRQRRIGLIPELPPGEIRGDHRRIPDIVVIDHGRRWSTGRPARRRRRFAITATLWSSVTDHREQRRVRSGPSCEDLPDRRGRRPGTAAAEGPPSQRMPDPGRQGPHITRSSPGAGRARPPRPDRPVPPRRRTRRPHGPPRSRRRPPVRPRPTRRPSRHRAGGEPRR